MSGRPIKRTLRGHADDRGWPDRAVPTIGIPARIYHRGPEPCVLPRGAEDTPAV